jgi:hypothetical protein
MQLRTKARIVNGLVFLGTFLSVFVLALIDNKLILLVFMIPLAGFAYCIKFLRCQVCGEYMDKRKTKFLGAEFTYWGGWTIPKTCSRCGAKF